MGPGMATSDFKAKGIRDIPYYQGPNMIPGIRFHLAGRDLGVTAWGMNIIDIEAGCSDYLSMTTPRTVRRRSTSSSRAAGQSSAAARKPR